MSDDYITRRRNLPNLNEQFNRGQNAATRGGNNSAFTPRPGEREYFQPQTDVALWFAFCPEQKWTTDFYDRGAQDAVHFEDYLYYPYVLHMVSMGQNRFSRIICSTGAHKDKPCLGCGVRRAFFKWRDQEEKRTGFRPDKKPPIGDSDQFAFAGVLLEHVAKVQKRDKDTNRLISTKDNRPVMIDAPLTTLPPEQAKELMAAGQTTFGLRKHYSVGQELLGQIKKFNLELQNYCANCAEKLYAYDVRCPECKEVHRPHHADLLDGLPVCDQTLTEIRGQKIRCSCGYHGTMPPIVECECGSPLEGTLLDFALRLKVSKPTDKKPILEYTAVRPIKYFTEKYPATEALLRDPLKLDEIFAPTELPFQKARIPERMRGDGVSAAPRTQQNEKALTEDYTFSDSSDSNKSNDEIDPSDFEA